MLASASHTGTARAAHDLVLSHSDDEWMAFGQAFTSSTSSGLHEAHVRHRRVELFGGLERGFSIAPKARIGRGDRFLSLRLSRAGWLSSPFLLLPMQRPAIPHAARTITHETCVEICRHSSASAGAINREIGHRAQVGEVEGAVVGRPIAADEAGAVERKQQPAGSGSRPVVDQLVVPRCRKVE